MNKRISFHELAEFELNDAAAFFESNTAGLGVRFLSAVGKPQASPIIRQQIRRKVVWKFPYSIMFTIKSNHIRILAIANQKRRPFYWRGRT
jgi:hypothetical protein